MRQLERFTPIRSPSPAYRHQVEEVSGCYARWPTPDHQDVGLYELLDPNGGRPALLL
jgi:hypothetical protein